MDKKRWTKRQQVRGRLSYVSLALEWIDAHFLFAFSFLLFFSEPFLKELLLKGGDLV